MWLLLLYLSSSIYDSTCSNSWECVDYHPNELEDFRLPRWFIPSLYDIELLYSMETGFAVLNGTCKLTLVPIKNTARIYLNILEMDVYDVSVFEKETNSTIDVARYDNICYREAIGIYLKRSMINNFHYVVTMIYSIPHLTTDSMLGLYMTPYMDEKGELLSCLSTAFEPANARRAFPCFDEPDMKSVFKMTIIHPKEMMALSNMPILNTLPISEQLKKTEFLPTLKMPTYLLAFFVGQFEKVEKDKFAIYSRPELVNYTSMALNLTADILGKLTDIFQMNIGLPKLDSLLIPNFWSGGLENWGLITYQEDLLIYHKDSTDLESLTFMKRIISHELVHTWLGNIVTCKWWDILFIQEGGTVFWEYIAMAAIEPHRNADVLFVLNRHFTSILLDDFETWREPIIQTDVAMPRELLKMFCYATYAKAAAVFRMLLYHLGKTAFLEGIRHVISTHRFDNVGTEDLYESLDINCQKHCKEWKNYSMAKMMDSWTNLVGHPMVILIRNYTHGSAIIRQHFYLDPKFSSIFSIPITYTTKKEQKWEAKTRYILDTKEVTIEKIAGDEEWVMTNLQMAGLYRTQYDIRNWELIVNEFYKSHQIFPTLNRAQIIHDLGHYALDDPLAYMTLYLNLTRYLYFEREEAPWIVFLVENRGFMIALYDDLEAKVNWVMYLRYIMGPIYQKYYWDKYDYGSVVDKESVYSLRNRIIHFMCILGDPDCNTYALNLFRSWRDGKIPKIPVDFKKIAYCNGLFYGKKADWDFMFKHFKEDNITTEQQRIAGAAKCARKKEVFYETSMKDVILPLQNESRVSIVPLFENFMNQAHLSFNASEIKNVDIHDFYYGYFDDTHINQLPFFYDMDQYKLEADFFDIAQKLLLYKKKFASKAVKDFLDDWYINGENFFKEIYDERMAKEQPAYSNDHLLMNSLLK